MSTEIHFDWDYGSIEVEIYGEPLVRELNHNELRIFDEELRVAMDMYPNDPQRQVQEMVERANVYPPLARPMLAYLEWKFEP